MTSIKSSEDPAVRFAKLSAELHYSLADTLVENLGEEKGKVDHILFGGFGLALIRPRCKTKGDRVCDFQVQMKEGENIDGGK